MINIDTYQRENLSERPIRQPLSGHLITYCTRKSTKVIFNKHQGVKIRSLKNYSKESFVNELCKIDWSEVVSCDSVDKA